MAIGLARTMNVRFPQNFNSPYKAQNVIDYWQRWHMTLTKFLTSYLYTPIAMATRWRMASGIWTSTRRPTHPWRIPAMVSMPMMITMALVGIWHGAGLKFLVFGLLHGVYIFVNHAIRVFYPGRRSARLSAAVLRCLATYLSVLVASVFFRAPTVASALDVLNGMAGLHGGSKPSRPSACCTTCSCSSSLASSGCCRTRNRSCTAITRCWRTSRRLTRACWPSDRTSVQPSPSASPQRSAFSPSAGPPNSSISSSDQTMTLSPRSFLLIATLAAGSVLAGAWAYTSAMRMRFLETWLPDLGRQTDHP